MSLVYRFVNPLNINSFGAGQMAAPLTASLTINGGKTGAYPGKMTFGGSGGSSSDPSTPQAWYFPVEGAPESLWAKVTVTAGASPTQGDVGEWINIDGVSIISYSWLWTRNTSGTTTATITIELSADGSTVIASKTGVDVTVQCT